MDRVFKSQNIKLYETQLGKYTEEQIAFVDQVFEVAERNYSRGGDTIVECYGPEEILEEFKTLEDVRESCGWAVESRLNARWGEDSDPELRQAAAFKEWES